MTNVEPLRTPVWERLLTLARRRLERDGGELTGSVRLTDPSDDERKLIIGMTGMHRSAAVKSVKIHLGDLDAAVDQTYGMSLVAALAVLSGPVRNRPPERSEEAGAKDAVEQDARSRVGQHASEPWFDTFLQQLGTDGTIARLVRRGDGDQLGWASQMLALLPQTAARVPISVPVLAERATGNTKALSGTPIATLVLRGLAAGRDPRLRSPPMPGGACGSRPGSFWTTWPARCSWSVSDPRKTTWSPIGCATPPISGSRSGSPCTSSAVTPLR